MKIFIEGPYWSGMWTEIIAAALHESGHRVDCCYHNRKSLRDRIALAATTLRPGEDRKSAWHRRHRQQLLEAMSHSRWDLLLSVQGTLDRQTARQLRQHSPGLRIIYWWGDILTAQARARIDEAAGFADRLLVSYRGSYEALRPACPDKLVYFPFGVSREFHTVGPLSARDRKRFTADVAFVGTYYPERGALIRYLNTRLDTPVAVWGRGWRNCHGVRHHGALSLADSLKVYACSKISLNLHHIDTPNGFNMKYYEIPAAGGFQICDWQPLLRTTEPGRQTVACRSLPEFAAQVKYYLAHEQQRRKTVAANTQAVFATTDYRSRLDDLIDQTSTCESV
ncbi:MAG: glycosyltransferase [Gammaproteobacteria bacterium]